MKDTTDFINLIENMHISNNVVLGTLDVSYLYTNIPQTEGIDIINFAIIMKSAMSIICQFPQMITGTFTAHTRRELFQI